MSTQNKYDMEIVNFKNKISKLKAASYEDFSRRVATWYMKAIIKLLKRFGCGQDEWYHLESRPQCPYWKHSGLLKKWAAIRWTLRFEDEYEYPELFTEIQIDVIKSDYLKPGINSIDLYGDYGMGVVNLHILGLCYEFLRMEFNYRQKNKLLKRQGKPKEQKDHS